MSFDLRSHGIACRAVPTTASWRAPDSLRPDGRAKRHLVDLVQPDHAPVGGQLVAVLNLIMPGLPSDRSVIALWEVDEVTRTRSLPPRCSCRSSTTDHLGDLPARRGRL